LASFNSSAENSFLFTTKQYLWTTFGRKLIQAEQGWLLRTASAISLVCAFADLFAPLRNQTRGPDTNANVNLTCAATVSSGHCQWPHAAVRESDDPYREFDS